MKELFAALTCALVGPFAAAAYGSRRRRRTKELVKNFGVKNAQRLRDAEK